MDNRSIGVFDSGIGGTSIWKEIVELMPYEDTFYLADSLNAPYGEKDSSEIIRLCIKNTELLIEKNCKIIVVACNTATTNAIDYLRNHYTIPFIGIEPAIKPASLKSNTKVVGILATKGTLSSSLFQETSSLYRDGVEIIEREGKGIVQLIETGKLYSEEMKALLKRYVQPMLDRNMDYLVLGCSHYPYLIPILRRIIPEHVNIIDSGMAVAKQTFAVLKQRNLLANESNKGQHIFYSNSNAKLLQEFVGKNAKVEAVNF